MVFATFLERKSKHNSRVTERIRKLKEIIKEKISENSAQLNGSDIYLLVFLCNMETDFYVLIKNVTLVCCCLIADIVTS